MKINFFTDCNDKNTFSLDHVVGICKKDRYTTGTYSNPTYELVARTIVVTLIVAGEKEKFSISFPIDDEDKRDAEFRRLSKALSKVNS